MDNVLNRRLFNMGGAVTPGLDAFKGKALQARGMPMTGIMGFAEGGNPEVEKTKVADAYKGQEAGVREGSILDYLTSDSGGGLRGDLSEFGAMILGAPYDLPVAVGEELGVTMPEGYQSGSGYSNVMGGLDALMGVENRLPSETLEPDSVQWEDAEGNRVTSSQAQQMNEELMKLSEGIVNDPQLSEAAQNTVKILDENLAKAEANEDVNGAILAGAGEPVSDDPAENRKNLGQRIRDIASGMGIELTEEDSDPQVNPHIGMALLLAGSKLLQGGTGSDAGDAGQALETATSYLANKAEKEAERKASNLNKLQQIALQEGLEAELGTGSTTARASVLQEADELRSNYAVQGIDLPGNVALRLATRAATADPAARVAAFTSDLMDSATGVDDLGVAQNYAGVMVNQQTALQDIQRPDIPVAYKVVGDERKMLTANDLRTEIQAAKQIAGDKNLHPAQALYNAGVQPLSFDQMLGIAYGRK